MVDVVNTKKQDLLIRVWIYMVCMVCALTNISGYLAYDLSLSHHTGNTVYMLDYSYERLDFRYVLVLVLLIILFTLGAIVASFVNRNRDFHMEHKYGEVQFAIGVVILLLYFCSARVEAFVAFLAFSLGIENGLIRSLRGFGFKTTHITGTLSDMGSMIGYYLQKVTDTGWKVRLELFLFLFFIIGIVLGLFLYTLLQNRIFILCGCSYIVLGLVYMIMRKIFLNDN